MDRGQGLVDVAAAVDALYLGEETLREDVQQRGLACWRSAVQRTMP